MRPSLCAFLLLLLAAAALAQPPAPADPEQELRTLEEQRHAAIAKRDHAALDRIYAAEFRGILGNGQVVGREQLYELFGRTDLWVAFATDQIEVRVFGDTALFTGRLVGRKSDGETVSMARFSHLFVRRDGRWQCVAGQSTAVSAAAAPEVVGAATASAIRFTIAPTSEWGGAYQAGESLPLRCTWKNVGSTPVVLDLKDHDAYHGTLDYPLGLWARVETAEGKPVVGQGSDNPDSWGWTWYLIWSTTFQPEMPGDRITLAPGEEVVRTVPLRSVLKGYPGLRDGLPPGRYIVQLALGAVKSNPLALEVTPPQPAG